jgi:tripartite-type tricarboxylate transporter receptor subunit TctC
MDAGMNPGRRALLRALPLGLLAAAAPLRAQGFPDRFIKLIVPFAPGGATDVLGRILAKRMGELLGQPMVVENHAGAAGTIGTEFVARQPADGYTVLLVNAIPHTSSRKLYPGLKYDPVKSFTPIGALGSVRYLLVVNNDVQAKTLTQFIELVRAQPGKLNFGSAGMGSAPHLAMELFMRAAGIDMVHVPYQGSGPAMTDLMGGRIQAAMDNVAAVPLVKAGKLRALAITGRTRSAALPDVPTFAEAGLPSYDVTGAWGLIAPAGVPAPIVDKLSNALAEAVKDATVRETLITQGIDPEPGSAQQYGAVLARESEKWSRLIDEAKIKL